MKKKPAARAKAKPEVLVSVEYKFQHRETGKWWNGYVASDLAAPASAIGFTCQSFASGRTINERPDVDEKRVRVVVCDVVGRPEEKRNAKATLRSFSRAHLFPTRSEARDWIGPTRKVKIVDVRCRPLSTRTKASRKRTG